MELDVTNTGQREGADVAQAYVAYPSDADEPPKQLRGFAKVKLRTHETRHVTMTLSGQALSIWDTTEPVVARLWKIHHPGWRCVTPSATASDGHCHWPKLVGTIVVSS